MSNITDPKPYKYNGIIPKIRRFIGKLFIKGIKPEDVDQSNIGDCYFVAAVAAVAQYSPDILFDAVKKTKGETFQVTFFDMFFTKKGKLYFKNRKNVEKTTVTVDSDFYTYKGKPMYGYNKSDTTELWFAIMEKGYATWKGGYDEIGQGGYPSIALSEITGERSKVILTELKMFKSKKMRADTIRGFFEKAQKKNYKVVCGTYGEGEVNNENNKFIYSGHAYSYMGIKGGRIRLRNPWGIKNEGYFYITVSDFVKYFHSIAYVK